MFNNKKIKREDEMEKEKENEIDRRIKILSKKKPELKYRELRQIAKEEINKNAKGQKIIDSLNLQDNVIILIDIASLRKARDERIKKQIKEIKDEKMSYTEKLLKVLNDMNSSETFEYKGSEVENQNDMNNSKEGSELDMSAKSKMEVSVPSINKEQSLSMQGSTLDESAKSTNVSSDMEIKHLFWIKNQYYDISEFSEKKEGLKIQILKDKEKEFKSFIYDNNLNTYYFTISQRMKKFYELDSITPKLIPDNNFNKENGLYFCGKKIEKYNKTCKANEMMCKDCMKKNKEMYNLNGHRSILININGRTCSNSFKNRMFHCFGKFIVNKEIKNCIEGEFTCGACQELNKEKEYYYEGK